MANKEKARTISEELESLLNQQQATAISLGDIVHQLRERGFGMLMMVLVLPNCVPIPVPPGVSTAFSLPLLFFTIQMLWGRAEPWIPQRLAEKEIRLSYLSAVLGRIAKHLRRMEKLVRPRLLALSSPFGERFIGFWWLVFAVSIAIPLPMTNFLPGIGILISALGLLNRDGYVMLAGIGIGIFGVGFTTAVLVVGADVILRLLAFG